jgi:alpha-beta hydrolase superfamily lysophospholipase
MKILYLHGWNSVVGGVKPTYLKAHGHEVIEPALDHDDFQAALQAAQAAFDQHQPDVVVGSSRGGAVAVNLDSGNARLVLICPAWKKWGKAQSVKPGTQIIHSRADDVVPFEDSVELISMSRLPATALIEAGQDHRLADPEPLAALLRAVEGMQGPA